MKILNGLMTCLCILAIFYCGWKSNDKYRRTHPPLLRPVFINKELAGMWCCTHGCWECGEYTNKEDCAKMCDWLNKKFEERK